MGTPLIHVWLSHDGYRDPDDNLSMLVGAAQTRTVAKSDARVRVAGVVFGDTKDGGQYYMLNPTGTAPAGFGEDARYGDAAGNRQAEGNYAFFRQYALPALAGIAPNWKNFDLLKADAGGLRSWNFHATARTEITAAARALADDIVDAIARTGGAAEPAKLVVYSAGGGANVAGEAIGFLLNQGFAMADIVKHFAVIQHGNNWVTNYEPEARELTRAATIAISNQNLATYADDTPGPDLKHALPRAVVPDASGFGAAFAEALGVAIGARAFAGLPDGAVFRTTRDASDSGSHAFAADLARLLAAWDDRLGDGNIVVGDAWAHLIEEATGWRSRVIYDGFRSADVLALLESGKIPTGETRLTVAAGADDVETLGGTAGAELDLGEDEGAANPVGLRFGGLGLADAEIASAYLVFTASAASAAGGSLTIQLQDYLAAKDFGAGKPLDQRTYLEAAVAWDDLGAWEAGQDYRSPDVSALIEALIEDDGPDALDALAFRISGTGSHSALAFEGGAAPGLAITYDLA